MRIRIPGLLVHGVAAGWTATWRISRLHEERLARARAMSPTGSVVGVFWHQSLLAATAVHHHARVAALVSRAADGGLIAAHLERVGIRVVRGSSRQGGAAGAKELMRAVADGWAIATPCDGPTGPAFRVKPGMLEIARRHGVPLIPFGLGAGRCWEFARAWDRFRLPWPGTRVAVAYGEPIIFPPAEPGEAELAERCAAVGERLQALEREATAACGRA
jgi:lysophospholipid acyltransferase (LPLAT)-like uncharacterized protein